MRFLRPSPPDPAGVHPRWVPRAALMMLRVRRGSSALPPSIKPMTSSPQATEPLLSSTRLPITPILKTPSPELGLLSLLFVLSMAIGAIFSLAIISLPTINAFKKLGDSIHKFSQVVSEEVPSTMSSLKLSALEINQLAHQLSILRQSISATASQSGKKATSTYPRPTADKD